jgi:hypothetical protein
VLVDANRRLVQFFANRFVGRGLDREVRAAPCQPPPSCPLTSVFSRPLRPASHGPTPANPLDLPPPPAPLLLFFYPQDLVAEGMLALERAAARYERLPGAPARFGTFAAKAVYNVGHAGGTALPVVLNDPLVQFLAFFHWRVGTPWLAVMGPWQECHPASTQLLPEACRQPPLQPCRAPLTLRLCRSSLPSGHAAGCAHAVTQHPAAGASLHG